MGRCRLDWCKYPARSRPSSTGLSLLIDNSGYKPADTADVSHARRRYFFPRFIAYRRGFIGSPDVQGEIQIMSFSRKKKPLYYASNYSRWLTFEATRFSRFSPHALLPIPIMELCIFSLRSWCDDVDEYRVMNVPSLQQLVKLL